MIIAIDIDDTLVTTTASVLAQHYADTGELVDINDVRTYRIEDYISEEYKDDFYKIFLKKEMWKRIKLLPNCVETIKRLHEKQHQIYFCTSTEPQNIAKKFSFLRRTFPFINVRKALINTPNKQLIHFDVLIDDAVHNVVNAPYHSILFSQPWNENFDDAEHDNIFRVNDWTQVEDVVEFIERLRDNIMIHKKFMDIQRIKENYAEGFSKGDYIVIQEKIDGANAAIRYDFETDSIVAQSRKNILSLSNNLRGFWEWSQTLDKELVKSVLGDNLIAFCEWLVPHSVKYPEERYNHAYFYDVYDISTEAYLPQDKATEIIDKLGLTYVPCFMAGEFVSWEDCMRYVGETELGGEYGEGIVVKNQTRLNDPNTRSPFYLKIVGEKFTEVHKSKKPISPEQLQAREESKTLAETIVTPARVEKLLNKFIDEGILPEDWGATEMPIVAKNLLKGVYEDCVKEEPETVKQIDNFGKVANSIAMQIARNIMEQRRLKENYRNA